MGPGETASQRIEIVPADDHAMIRSGLRRVLDTEDVLERALAKDPEDREQSAGQLARDALDAL